MSNKKFILIIIGIILVSVMSVFVMINSYKDSNKELEPTSTEIIINSNENLNDNIELNNKIEEDLSNGNYLSDKFPLLSKYPEKYISVAEWIISELIKEWDENGFTVVIEDEVNGTKEVDGLTVYKDSSEYMTYLLNTNADIEDLFFFYCEDEYTELRYTYLLGKEENQEYEATSSTILYQELLNLYQNKEFKTIIDKVDNLLKNYKFTMPQNYDICHIYQDAKLSLDYWYDLDLIEYGLDYMNSTETYFINFVRIPVKSKLLLVKDTNSLIPDRETSINIDDIAEINLDEYPWIISQFEDYVRNAKSVTKIEYKQYNPDDNNYYSCIAYIANNFDRTKNLLTIKWNDEADCYLFTAKEYKKLFYGTTEESTTEESTIEETKTEESSIEETKVEESLIEETIQF